MQIAWVIRHDRSVDSHGMPIRRLAGRRAAGLAWLVGCSIALLLGGSAEGRAVAHPSAEASVAARHAIGFRSRALLVEHYRKHGREFGPVSMSEYLVRAQALRDCRAGGDVLQIERADGVTTRFDRRSGAFLAFGRDGVIRTFFRPRDGERYFRRQALRHTGAG
jgi:hypothetical protein